MSHNYCLFNLGYDRLKVSDVLNHGTKKKPNTLLKDNWYSAHEVKLLTLYISRKILKRAFIWIVAQMCIFTRFQMALGRRWMVRFFKIQVIIWTCHFWLHTESKLDNLQMQDLSPSAENCLIFKLNIKHYYFYLF